MSSVDEKAWLETPLGQYLLRREQAYHDQVVANIFGFNALQLGLLDHDLLRTSRIPTRLRAGNGVGVALRMEPEFLPVASQSIDLLLLPHLLEFSAHPHQILREAERVLMPEGNLIISGYNPFSLWGLWRMLLNNNQSYPWCGRFISLSRLKDWLALLGFEVVGGRMCCYEPPFSQEQLLGKFRFMEDAGDRWWALAGGVYFIHAKKRVQGMRLIMPGWNDGRAARKGLAPAAQKLLNQRTSCDK
ncbi:MAG: methyltransferase domain-containing protein [Sulfurimicrobium sp.]|jgi:SAM-dependent methyltransferase|nr:methyltransferase domain-containing protein [Sulfurimicrobium sp.]MDP2963613.1 methyltransferase domain-containing protein [Sulfurimicrobium sp.]